MPQLFVCTGSNTLIDPKKYPVDDGVRDRATGFEGIVWAKYILAERPNAKIGILYQDDDFGSDHMGPFLAALGDKAKTMVVAQGELRRHRSDRHLADHLAARPPAPTRSCCSRKAAPRRRRFPWRAIRPGPTR